MANTESELTIKGKHYWLGIPLESALPAISVIYGFRNKATFKRVFDNVDHLMVESGPYKELKLDTRTRRRVNASEIAAQGKFEVKGALGHKVVYTAKPVARS